MKNPLLPIVSLLCIAATAFAQDEYNSTLGPEARALSKELQAIARTSPKRFDAALDVSKLKAWLIGSCPTAREDIHFIAYFPSPMAAYVAVFRQDKQLHALWRRRAIRRRHFERAGTGERTRHRLAEGHATNNQGAVGGSFAE